MNIKNTKHVRICNPGMVCLTPIHTTRPSVVWLYKNNNNNGNNGYTHSIVASGAANAQGGIMGTHEYSVRLHTTETATLVMTLRARARTPTHLCV